MRTLTDIRIYTSVVVVNSAIDIVAQSVHSERGLLRVTTSDGNDYLMCAGRKTTACSHKRGDNTNIMATMLRGADGQGVTGGYVDEHGVLHLIMTDGTTVAAGEIPLDNYLTKTEVAVALDEKVDKVEGKELTDVNFTHSMSAKLTSLSNYDDTDVRAKIEHVHTVLNSITTGQSSEVIDSWNDVVAFLQGLGESENLDDIITSLTNLIGTKQDKIRDIDEIRRGASQGLSSVQPESLADVAFTGSYKSLKNTPTIPSMLDIKGVAEDVVKANMPTEIATAPQRVLLSSAPAKNEYMANIVYVWEGTPNAINIDALSGGDDAHDSVWTIRFGCTSETPIIIAPSVLWKDGREPSIGAWCVCELTFRKQSGLLGGNYLGEWKQYK
jgi:hypothetical protein